jgi:pimeloyl-[acyl-carrier protein] methyl ester esterase
MSDTGEIEVLLLPGLDGTGDLLANFSKSLGGSRTVQVVRYPTENPLGYDDLVAYATSRLPDGRSVLVAESFSGPIGIELAASDPRVVGLILASSFARHPWPPSLAWIASVVPFRWIPLRFAAWLLLGSSVERDLKERVRRVIKRLHPAVVKARMTAVLTVDKLDVLREVGCPILCLRGHDDRLVGERSIEEIRSVQPTCQIQSLNGPHMLLETRPRECADAIEQFCKELT